MEWHLVKRIKLKFSFFKKNEINLAYFMQLIAKIILHEERQCQKLQGGL